ncbi:phosphatidylserine decarboxylase [Clostridium algidicarnis]|uniref:phosphatidylserine decarboxylase n=1 Tax=Clostridium algidicarnis TaxID=37659 RepID=UPI00162735A7|nr:phosphatidylserine decarboxylase [Clostridium algidicarnis]MBB6632243.1 phosphatidylserine decarboxylase [Clostridium algidicarnis]
MIKYYNRNSNEYEVEKVAGDKYLKWNYSSPVGLTLLEMFIKKKLFSKVYGAYCDSSLSKKKINSFIKEFNIDMNLCEKNLSKFNSFNDFFIRSLKKEARPIDENSNMLISPGDGRLFAYDNIDMDNLVQVKGLTYSLNELIEDKAIADKYNGGLCLVLRLCPTDYHRFHFIDSGICSDSKKVNGDYYSVNPIALEKIPKLYCQNKREWSLLKSENFGDVILVEVGATCVGTIVQTYNPNHVVKKGDEKGYFKFGGSTTIMFIKPNTVKIDEDILRETSLGYETKVVMGETIGKKISI